MHPTITIIHKLSTQLVCAVLCRSDALAVMPFGAVKSPIVWRHCPGAHKRHFQLPAYAIYKPMQAVSDPALEYLESSMLHVASSLKSAANRQSVRHWRPLLPQHRHSRTFVDAANFEIGTARFLKPAVTLVTAEPPGRR